MRQKLSVKDIHHDGVAEEFDRLTLIDLEKLLSNKERFVDTGCPACHSKNVVYAFEHQGLSYRRCRDCELLYISPAPTEDMHLDYVIGSQAMAYWREMTPASMKTSRRPMYRERAAYAQAVLSRLGCLAHTSLEIGAGNGEFAEEMALASGMEKIVLLEPQALEMDMPNVEIIRGGFDEIERSERKFDVVFAWEVIEHILEPDHFLRLVHKAMKPGAPLILSTPNERSVETRKLGTHSSNILFDHVRLYNPQAIVALLKRNGFRVVEFSTPGQLDVERLQNFLQSNPSAFEDDPALRLILSDETCARNFQEFLRENHLSSHMRVVAVADGEWQGGNAPLFMDETSCPAAKKLGAHDGDGQPKSFNAVVLPHTLNMSDPYPPKMMRHVLHELAKVKGGRLLDLGGGWGAHAHIAANLGFDVISLDREPATVAVNYKICDITKDTFPVTSSSIDVVFSKSVIEHFYIRELPHIMGEVLRVLKPGGVIVVLTPDWEYNMREFYKVFTHVTPYTKDSLLQCFKMYGFEDASTENMIQLPQVWTSRVLNSLARIIAYLPLPRSSGKWIRWSKERVLVGIAHKPMV